jgi:hypothetical protein
MKYMPGVPALFVASWVLSSGALAQSLETGDRECTQCKDLCYLVDQYWQKERGIEVWKRYAASTPERHRIPLPARVTDMDSFEKLVYEEKLPRAISNRPTLPCKTKDEWEQEADTRPPFRPGHGKYGVGLETQAFKSSACEIVYGKDKLQGDVEKKWRNTHACKGSADAELAHEQVHQRICRDTWIADQTKARDRLSTIENIAESELQAWKRHRNQLRDQILKLAKPCGWEPTDRQQADPNAVPTETQTKRMEALGWNAVSALFDTTFP